MPDGIYIFGVRFENTKDVVESYVHVIAATTVINEYYFAFICLSYKNQYWKKEEGRNVVLILFSRKQLPLCHCYHCCVKVSNQICRVFKGMCGCHQTAQSCMYIFDYNCFTLVSSSSS